MRKTGATTRAMDSGSGEAASSASTGDTERDRAMAYELLSFLRRFAPPADEIRGGTFTHCSARYDGSKESNALDRFISAASMFKSAERIRDDDAVQGLAMLLTDRAADWWEVEKIKNLTWDEAISSLRRAFDPKKPAYMLYNQIISEKQDENTSTSVFVNAKRKLLMKLRFDNIEEVQLDMVYGQLTERIKDCIPRETVTNLNELVERANRIEERWMEKALSRRENGNRDTHHKSEPRKQNPWNKIVRCSFCRMTGHEIQNCRKKRAEATNQPIDEKPKISCYGCGAPGIVRTKCPRCAPKIPTSSADKHKLAFCAIKHNVSPSCRPKLPIEIGKFLGEAFLDTGAKLTVISTALYNKLKKKRCPFDETEMDITMADGVVRRMQVETATLPITVQGRTTDTKCLKLPGKVSNNTLLGAEFIRDAGIIINLPQSIWSFADKPTRQYQLLLEDEKGDAEVAEILANIGKKIPTVMSPLHRTPSPDFENNDFNHFLRHFDRQIPQLLSPLAETPVNWNDGEDWGPPTTIKSPNRKRRTIVRLNESFGSAAETPTKLENTITQSLRLFSTSPRRTPRAGIFSIDATALTLRSDEGRHLTDGQKAQVDQLLIAHEDAFRKTGPPVKQVEHHIVTSDNPPISNPPYRLTPAKKAIMREEIDKMLAEDIVEECKSPWAAPVVLVTKSDGSVRFCIDYRQLNAITVPDTYPLPRIDDLLHATNGAAYLTTMDLRAGYWQIGVCGKDRSKTSFITPFGTYQFKRMPFGLRNAPATFQRLIDRVRTSLGEVNLLAYLDDLIVLSATFEDHIADLAATLKQLHLFGLRINRGKCHFCCEEVKYLGHRLTKAGISTDPDKVIAIQRMAEPRNMKQVQTFLQTCSWYRRFVPQFAKIAKPLSDLTKKTFPWTWERKQQEAFENLKTLLISAPILRQADVEKPFSIKTDASNYALGAVLVQGEGENEHPVEYASRLLSSAERNYSTTEREALAVVWAANKFRGYIEGAEVTIITDHQALRWLMTLKSPTGRLARWALSLQPYNLTIKYIPGRTNVVADTLSRPPMCEDATALFNITVDFPRRGAENIRAEQLKDPSIRTIIECFERPQANEDLHFWTKKGYLQLHGVLYRYSQLTESEEAQLVVPKHEQTKILNAYHDDPTAGHYGVQGTLQRIALRYYWPNMYKTIKNYIKECLECQRYKATNLKPAGLVQTSPMNQRFETISFDLFGPLPPTTDGKTWVFIVEDVATKWVELFALERATAENCAQVLIDEIFLRYGTPRRMISDNGTQFVTAVMQQISYCMEITHSFTPVYHPEANPVERKNRDLKPRLAILVKDDHTRWAENLPAIRFALNTAYNENVGHTSAYLTFGRQLRSPDDVNNDLREIIVSENFVPEITPRLLRLADTLKRARDIRDVRQDKQKQQTDKSRRPSPDYQPGDHVLIQTHMLSQTKRKVSAKFAPRRDGPYVILQRHGATSYEVAAIDKPNAPLGIYHTSAITPYFGKTNPTPVVPLRKRGRPKKTRQQ